MIRLHRLQRDPGAATPTHPANRETRPVEQLKCPSAVKQDGSIQHWVDAVSDIGDNTLRLGPEQPGGKQYFGFTETPTRGM